MSNPAAYLELANSVGNVTGVPDAVVKRILGNDCPSRKNNNINFSYKMIRLEMKGKLKGHISILR